jgi:glutamate-1-semialdehyde 2,1-aminomutase
VAGIATLQVVSSGEPQRRADAVAMALRQGMNRCIQELGLPWRAYGLFSDFHIVTDYEGPQPDDDTFVPYGGDFARLSVPPSGALVEASRKAMLLEGVDWFGMRGITTAAHTEQDIAETLQAFGRMATRLQSEGLAR